MERQIHVLKRRARVAILLPQRVWPGSIYLAKDLLHVAGTLAARSTDVSASALFETRFIGRNMQPITGFGGAQVRPETTIADRKWYDIVIVPPQFAATAVRSSEDEKFAAWLVRQHQQGAFVLGLGSAILLAKAGLLDGLRATGVVAERALFTHSFPAVRYAPSQRLVAEDRIVTICGIGPIVDGCAHLIDHFHGAHADSYTNGASHCKLVRAACRPAARVGGRLPWPGQSLATIAGSFRKGWPMTTTDEALCLDAALEDRMLRRHVITVPRTNTSSIPFAWKMAAVSSSIPMPRRSEPI
jgi:transcriptional regulator GlxA family with amidase domain